jgi:hypothetical protein
MSVAADHRGIIVQGSNFPTSGMPVYLYAYGTNGGAKTFLASGSVVPRTTRSTDPVCFYACNAGDFWTELYQAYDPCSGGGYSQIEVDAWTYTSSFQRYEAATATVTATCSVPPR